jgi:hypothetical protein
LVEKVGHSASPQLATLLEVLFYLQAAILHDGALFLVRAPPYAA